MPSRNIVKIDVEECYYHIYTRGHGGRQIFRDDEDYQFFLDLFERHLSSVQLFDKYRKPYKHLREQIELLCYCLMSDHFHLLIFQNEQGAMSQLMRSVMTSYSCYFNKRYNLSGALFESRYKASLIETDKSVLNISRYIHLVPVDWRMYYFSSISAFFGIGMTDWIQPDRLIEISGSRPIYADFLDDESDYLESLDDIKDELANKI